jgi:hypothetical protein|tara:strand:- start:277 stop:789 length:513 start_codon:yes stop_codon:yes gene_type:complete
LGLPNGTTYNRWVEYPEYAIPRADHAYQAGPFLFSRPYGPYSKDDTRELLDWADTHGFECQIDAPSSWHPSTLLITVFDREAVDEFYVEAEKRGDAFVSSLHYALYTDSHSDIDRVYHDGWNRNGETGIFILNTLTSKHGVGGLVADTPNPDLNKYIRPQKHYSLTRPAR